MNSVVPHTERIHELTRLLEKNPKNELFQEELERLQRERSQEIDKFLQEQAVGISDATEKQLDAEQRKKYTSVRAQYRAACGLYRELQELVARNRELKLQLRRSI